MSTPLAHSSHL